VLETNTQPGMTPTSLTPEQAERLRDYPSARCAAGWWRMRHATADRRAPPPPIPHPSILTYRAQRLWLTPLFRKMLRVGLPAFTCIAGWGWYLSMSGRCRR
jgi:hypothetical protein